MSISRRRFFAVSGGSGAAAAFLAACGGDDETSSMSSTSTSTSEDTSSQFGEGDLGIVNYALTLEYLETAFYNDVAKSGLFKGDDLALIKSIADTEQQHVDALTATAKQLGGKPAAAPKAEFPLDDAMSVLKLAATVENLGAAAYLGQAANIESPDILAAALSIHSVEGRHAAVLNVLTGESPTPDGAFAKGADMQTVLDAVQPFLV
jgi:rubrerythrin